MAEQGIKTPHPLASSQAREMMHIARGEQGYRWANPEQWQRQVQTAQALQLKNAVELGLPVNREAWDSLYAEPPPNHSPSVERGVDVYAPMHPSVREYEMSLIPGGRQFAKALGEAVENAKRRQQAGLGSPLQQAFGGAGGTGAAARPTTTPAGAPPVPPSGAPPGATPPVPPTAPFVPGPTPTRPLKTLKDVDKHFYACHRHRNGSMGFCGT